jgi:4-hydroxybenzoate polyprenyltransferase/phosphoserine phosphatase
MTTQTSNSPVLQDQTAIALVVDLDGTLCRTDTLHEVLFDLAATAPLQLLRLPSWLAEGRAGLKARLADKRILDSSILPMNPEVIELVRAARDSGRATALVSAADHRQVTAIANSMGLFDEAYGSAEGTNLKGEAKAAFLSDHFGPKQFDYVGDSHADLPVWATARSAISVGANPRLRRAVEIVNADVIHIDPPHDRSRSVLKALRPHQWSKNLLLFLPMLAAHDLSALPAVLLGFVAFCLTASAVYIVNDLMDLSADRAHPRKRNRPFAAGDLTAVDGVLLVGGLLLGALVIGILTGNLTFLGILCLYFSATFAYSIWLKRKLVVDVLTLAGLYTIRVIAGGAAASVILSPWMLGFSMFLFLGLAAIKRQAELTDQLMSGRDSRGRAYEIDDLPILRGMAISASNAAVLVLALYISSDAVQSLYQRPGVLWLICPMLLYWSLRMIMKTHRGGMTDDPIVFAVTDRVSLLIVVACGCVALAAAL